MSISPIASLAVLAQPLAAGLLQQAGDVLQSFGEHLSGDPSTDTVAKGDGAPTGDTLADLLQAADTDSAPQSALRDQGRQTVQKLRDSITDQLEAAGVDLSQPISFEIRAGQVVVDPAHPDAATIESVLQANPELKDAAAQLESIVQALQAPTGVSFLGGSAVAQERLSFTITAGELNAVKR